MRIGVEATALQGNKSGVGYYTEHLLRGVMRAAPEHDYLVFVNRDVRATWTPLGAETLYGRRFRRPRALWMQTALPRALAETRPALCHFTNYLAPLACPCPSIVTIYDMTIFLTPQFHHWKKRVLDRVLVPPAARRAAAILTLSESARHDIVRRLGVPAARVHVVGAAAAPGFRPVTDPAEQARVRARYGLTGPYILYVGTIEPRKNLVRLIQAFARLKAAGLPHRLLLVGQPGWKDAPIYAEVARLGLTGQAVFTGYVPEADLPALYTLAEALAFPSIYEGFGLPVIEAMACGTPVLTSRSSSLEEIAADSALLVDPFSVEAIAAGLARLHADPALRADLARRGARRAAAYTWERASAATLAVYAQVGRHARSRGPAWAAPAPAAKRRAS